MSCRHRSFLHSLPSRLVHAVWMLVLLVTGGVHGQAITQSSSTISSGAGSLRGMPLSPGATVAGPKVFAPSLPRTAYTRYPWKTDIVATVFWAGEQPTANNPTPNHQSSWDVNWAKNFGGYDDPDPANRTADYTPKGITPGLNPFYIALPYNDCLSYKKHKPEAASIIPWFKTSFVKPGRSVLRGTWLAIRYGNQVCYAQWEDCGPFLTHDPNYVFGSARPMNPQNKGAGIDVSPAVRDYLGMPSGGKVDWRFVDVGEIPAGPWSKYGMNNHFVRIKELRDRQQQQLATSRIEELRRQREQMFNGGAQ
jgi:hypothetical protein